jgi:hypothetical protein
VLLVVEERGILAGRPQDFDSRPDSVWNILELTLSALFVLEMLIKLAALGWAEYTRSLKNSFDAIVTVATFVVVIIVYVPNAFSDARYIRLVLILRLMRVMRLLSASPQVRFVSSTFLAVLPDALRLLKVLFVVLYSFSSLGTQLFGGLINKDGHRAELALLANTSFAADDYFANNYNDLASGIVTTFELLIVNNWFVLCEGFVAVSSTWARLFFVAIYAVGPLVCLNVAVAFCVEAFLNFMEDEPTSRGPATSPPSGNATDGGAGGYMEASGTAACIDATVVSGTQTGLSGQWRATVSTRRTSRAQALLRSMLSPAGDGHGAPPLEARAAEVSANPDVRE